MRQRDGSGRPGFAGVAAVVALVALAVALMYAGTHLLSTAGGSP